MPYTGGTSFLPALLSTIISVPTKCQCPIRAGLHFYSTSLKASIYAGVRLIFSAHFSEYSDNSPNHGARVGRGQIVLLRYNFEVVLLVLL